MSLAKVNAEFRRKGLPLTLVKGQGYHYYVFDTVEPGHGPEWSPGRFETESVMTPYTRQQPVKRWVEDGVKWAEQFRVASNILPG